MSGWYIEDQKSSAIVIVSLCFSLAMGSCVFWDVAHSSWRCLERVRGLDMHMVLSTAGVLLLFLVVSPPRCFFLCRPHSSCSDHPLWKHDVFQNNTGNHRVSSNLYCCMRSTRPRAGVCRGAGSVILFLFCWDAVIRHTWQWHQWVLGGDVLELWSI